MATLKLSRKSIQVRMYNFRRSEEPTHDEECFYMDIAKLAADRSKDKERQVGACIVNKDKVIVAIG